MLKDNSLHSSQQKQLSVSSSPHSLLVTANVKLPPLIAVHNDQIIVRETKNNRGVCNFRLSFISVTWCLNNFRARGDSEWVVPWRQHMKGCYVPQRFCTKLVSGEYLQMKGIKRGVKSSRNPHKNRKIQPLHISAQRMIRTKSVVKWNEFGMSDESSYRQFQF